MKPTDCALSRRTFLRATGVCLALPMLESLGAGEAPIRRTVAVNIPLGFYSENFFPSSAGPDYASSEYLSLAEPIRNDFTVISGMSHPGVDGGHSAEKSFLTAAPHPGARGFKNSVSLDQVIAEQVGRQTRFSYLTVGDASLSWTANGVPIPQEKSPAKVYANLFMSGSGGEIERQRQKLADGHSILDSVLDDAQMMRKQVSLRDSEKLDQYFTAIREAEERIAKEKMWLDRPKPTVEAKQPVDVTSADVVSWLRSHFEVIRLALMTDSTRVVALAGANHSNVVPLDGVSMGYHGLSHHGKNPEMIKQLEIIDRATIQVWVDFVSSLKETGDGQGNLLDHTQILLGSNLGNASGHLTTNLPILFAGGDYEHGKHLAFDEKNNEPLCNLFLNMLQWMGVEKDSFATSERTVF